MITTPSESSPLLVGILVDVSASMTESIQNTRGDAENRLQSFQKALGDLALRAKGVLGGTAPDYVKVFAYGFGFGNPLSKLLGWDTPPVVDLLDKPGKPSSIVGLSYLSDHWQEYKIHVEGLAKKMFGDTPMRQGFSVAKTRFEHEEQIASYSGKILFTLSDGEPTDATVDKGAEIAATLRNSDVMLISCYVTGKDITEPRKLYGARQNDWPKGAGLMFDCASELPMNSPFEAYLSEYNWTVAPRARLFTQINQSEVLSEFLNMLLSPVEKQRTEDPARSSGRVFVSYSHKDIHWLDRLKVHLSPLVRNQKIDVWDDQRIRVGRQWKKEIDDALANANAAVLLVSPDFLASDFIQEIELPSLLRSAQDRGTRILPVIVAPCRYDLSPLAGFQAANSPDSPLSAIGKPRAESILVALSREIE